MQKIQVLAWIIILVSAALVSSSRRHRHTRNGAARTNHNAKKHINRHIEGLMSLRHQDGGWHNTAEAIIALQLTNQSSFFERDRSISKLKLEILENEFTIGKLSMYVMALKSVCENPRNYSGINLINKLENQFIRTLDSDLKPWYSIALAVQALCINDVGIQDSDIQKILSSQNTGGSFGQSAGVDTTAQMLIALQCVNTHNSAPSDDIASNISVAILRGSQYLKSQIDRLSSSSWIGNKYSTPVAFTALETIPNNLRLRPKRKKKIYHALQTSKPKGEAESAVTHRLLALANVTVLKLRRNWQCSNEIVQTPNVHPPNTQQSPTFNCPTATVQTSFFNPTIPVRLSVLDGENERTVSISGVKKDMTLLQVMKLAKCQNKMEFRIKDTSWGPSVVSINGIEADPSMNQYWSLVDVKLQRSLSVGVGQYKPSYEDHILFRLTSF